MNSITSIILEQATVAVGDRISGQLSYPDTAETLPEQITVALSWHIEGRGIKERQTLDPLVLDPQQFYAGYPMPFSLEVPCEGPITYHGSLLHILWEVQVTFSYPRQFKRKATQTQSFAVICREL